MSNSLVFQGAEADLPRLGPAAELLHLPSEQAPEAHQAGDTLRQGHKNRSRHSLPAVFADLGGHSFHNRFQ